VEITVNWDVGLSLTKKEIHLNAEERHEFASEGRARMARDKRNKLIQRKTEEIWELK
jgi:hypothetical protein